MIVLWFILFGVVLGVLMNAGYELLRSIAGGIHRRRSRANTLC